METKQIKNWFVNNINAFDKNTMIFLGETYVDRLRIFKHYLDIYSSKLGTGDTYKDFVAYIYYERDWHNLCPNDYMKRSLLSQWNIENDRLQFEDQFNEAIYTAYIELLEEAGLR